MGAGVNTSAGTRIFIGSTTSTQADPTKDTYVEIGEVTSIGEYGRQFGQITYSSLANRYVKKAKGTIDDGNIQLDLNASNNDTGQAAANAALNSDFDFNFKIQHADPLTPTGSGSVDYFAAKVMSFPTVVGNNMNVTTKRLGLGIESGTLTSVPAT